MRTVARWVMRAALLALLAAAWRDPSLPGAGPRRRVYVIDVSASARKATGADALTPDDALRMAAHDLASLGSDDQVALIAFAAKPAVLVPLTAASAARFPAHIEGLDSSSTDLPAALDMARALADGGEIVLFSDGRSTTGRIPVERIPVPVHPFPLGPLGGVDAAIRSLEAPASAPPGFSVSVRVTVESTGPWRGELAAGEERRALEFTGPGRQDVVLARTMPREGRGLELPLRLAGAGPDVCPENDEARVLVWLESAAPRVLVVSPVRSVIFSAPEWDARWASDLSNAEQADVIVLQDLRADGVGRADLDRLARRVRDEGVGLVALGGPAAFALGGWNGTPVEEILPFWAFPNERSAVVLVLDRSGSMNDPAPGRSRPKIEEATAAIRRALQAMHDDDQVALVTFADTADVRCPLVAGSERGRAAAALQNVSAGGPTVLSEALNLAGSTVRSAKAGRRRIVLVTDGRSIDEEPAIRGAARRLKDDGVGVTIVRIGDATTSALAILREAGAQELDGSNFELLESTISQAVARSRDLVGPLPGKIAYSGALDGITEPASLAMINRVTLKPGTEVVGRADATPVVAIRRAGRGRVAATVFSVEPAWGGALLQRLAAAVLPQGERRAADLSLRFEGDKLEISAAMRGADRPERLDVLVEGAPVSLPRRGENMYAATIDHMSDTATVRVGGRIAAVARRPHAPEFERVGPDLEALDALARATGGTRLEAPRDLARLPARRSTEPRSARPYLLAAALLVFLLDVGLALLPGGRTAPRGRGVR